MNNAFWAQVAGIIASIISGVAVYHITKEETLDKPPPTIQVTPDELESSDKPIAPPDKFDSSVPSATPQTTNTENEVSKTGVAIVFDPPSNVRDSPNGKILCSVRVRTTINIYDSTDSWYRTDICGEMGVIHDSQITFSPN